MEEEEEEVLGYLDKVLEEEEEEVEDDEEVFEYGDGEQEPTTPPRASTLQGEDGAGCRGREERPIKRRRC